MFLGCTESNSDIDNTNETLTNVTNVNITPITEPELKIMSVTMSQGTINIKVKNTGNATAKDVYVGIIGVNYFPDYSWVTDYVVDLDLIQVAYGTMMHEEYNLDTGFNTRPHLNTPENLTLHGKIIQKDYLGDISPGEIKTSKTGLILGYDNYIKMAWTSNYSEYTLY